MSKRPGILVGIDFSPNSQNALAFAGALCRDLSCRLILVHAFMGATKTGRLASVDRPVKATLEEEIEKHLKPVREQFSDLEVIEVVKKGEAKEVLLKASEKLKPILMVVGMQGVHADPSVFIGSTTGALVKFGNAPILAIPGTCRYVPFRKILFAVKNPHVASRQVIEPFLALASHYASQVTLLHVTRDSTPDLSRFPKPYPIGPHIHELYTSDSDNIYQSVLAYLEQHEADLLVVISRLRGFFEGIFAQAATSASTFHSELPVLVLHGGIRE